MKLLCLAVIGLVGHMNAGSLEDYRLSGMKGDSYDHEHIFGGVHLLWKVEDEMLHVTVATQTTGWVGLGISDAGTAFVHVLMFD